MFTRQEPKLPTLRDTVLQDLEIWNQLPEGARGRDVLLQTVESRVLAIATGAMGWPGGGGNAPERTRSGLGIALALFLLGMAGLTMYLALRSGGSLWWLVAAIPAGLIGVTGMIQDAIPRERDDKGKPVRRT